MEGCGGMLRSPARRPLVAPLLCSVCGGCHVWRRSRVCRPGGRRPERRGAGGRAGEGGAGARAGDEDAAAAGGARCSTPPCLPLLFCHPRPATRLTPPTTHPPHTHTRAQLTNAQFKRVKTIAGADFTDALIRKDVAKDLCKIASGINPTTGVPTRESLGCPP